MAITDPPVTAADIYADLDSEGAIKLPPKSALRSWGGWVEGSVDDLDGRLSTAEGSVAGLDDRATSLETSRATDETRITALEAIGASGSTRLAAAAVVATTNITKSALQTIDGYTTLAGDRVLLTGQTAPAENGLWVAATGAWSRASDMDAPGEFHARAVTVINGTLGAATTWSCSSTVATVGTDAVAFLRVDDGKPTINALVAGKADSATLSTEVQRGQYARDLSKVAISNGYLNTSGVFVSSGAWRCTDSIPCAVGDTITYSLWATNGTSAVAFFTSGGTLISKISGTNGGGSQITGVARAPANTGSVRICNGSSSINGGNAQTYSVLAYTPTVLAEKVAAADYPVELAPLAVTSGYIDKTTGLDASDNNWLRSDFFECQPGDYLTYSLWGNGAVGSLTFYDANGARISSISGGTTTAGVATPPATTRHGRLCYGAPSIAGSFVNTCVIQRTTGHSLGELDDRLSTVEQAVDGIINYVPPQKKIGNIATRLIGLRNTNSLDNTTVGTLQTLMEVAAQFSEVQLIFAAPNVSGSYTIADCAVSTSATRDLADNNNAASWVPVTFGGADAGVVPAAPGGIRAGYLLSDWITLPSAVRSDGGTGGIVVSRAYITTAASIPMTSIQGSTAGLSALATRTDGHRTAARWQAGDHVSTLTDFTSTTNLYTLGMVGVRYKANGAVITLLLSGDSICEGQKGLPWGDSFGIPISHGRTNPAGVAYEVANIAWAGSQTPTFVQRLQDFLDVGLSADIAFLTGGSGNDTGSGTHTLTDADIASMAANREASVALMQANEIMPIVFTWGPYGTGLFNYGASDWRRVADNASILMQAQDRSRWAVDFNEVLYDSTNSDGQQLPDMTLIADGLVHPNAAGYAAMAGAANAVLDRIMNVTA